MKKIAATLLFVSSSLMAMYAEQAYLYKDNRIMGAGGVNVALGGYSTSIFYNPAGLKQIKKEHGYVVDILGIQASASKRFDTFFKDLSDAMDSNDNAQLVDVLVKYEGEHFHANVTNYSSLSKNSDLLAWSVGLLVGADANYMTHTAGSANGESIETTSRGYGGVFVAGAKDFDTPVGNLDVGIGLKMIKQKSYEGLIPLSDLIQSDDIVQLMRDKYERDATGYGVDVGVNLHLAPQSSLKPTIGLSVMNIGDMKMDDNYGRQPMTVNVGIGLSPDVPLFDSLKIGVDLVDVLSANKVRLYNYNPSASEAYRYWETKNDGFMKKVRAGATLGVYDSSWLTLNLSGGWYQESYTAGVDMELTLLKLSFATYEESLGYANAEIKDRRYALQIGMGW